MGQKSSPIISKLGLTMFWNNMWDDKLNFSKKLKEDIFINMFFLLVFNNSVYINKFFFSKINLYFYQNINFQSSFISNKNYFLSFNTFIKSLNLMEFKPRKIKYKVYYLSKIWILRYQMWCCIIFTMYIPQILKQKKDYKTSYNFFLKKQYNQKLFNFFSKNLFLKKLQLDKKKKFFFFYYWCIFNKLTTSTKSNLNYYY